MIWKEIIFFCVDKIENNLSKMDAMDADDNLSDASLIEDDDEEEELIIQTSEQEYDEDVCLNHFTKFFQIY